MRDRLLAPTAIAMLVAGCAVSPSSPTTPEVAGDGPLWFTVLGSPGEAILMGTSPDDDRLRFTVAGASGERDVASLANPVAGIEGAWIRTAVANEAGLVAVMFEEPVDQRRLLVYDLNLPERPVHEAEGEPWHALGPRGLIAIGGSIHGEEELREVTLHDLASTPTDPSTYAVPDGIRVDAVSSDGAGLFALRRTDPHGLAETGTLGPGGIFEPGAARPYLVSGTELSVGPNGEQLLIAHGDGQGWSSTTVAARTDAGESTWYESRSDRGDPEPRGFVWDPNGRGLWLLLQTKEDVRLALLREPGRPEVVATLRIRPEDEELGPPNLVGIQPGGRTVALARPGVGGFTEMGHGARTILVDLDSGATREYAAGFVGWAAAGGSDPS